MTCLNFQDLNGTFFIIDSPKEEDLILGYDFLYNFNPVIDCKNELITYEPSHKDYNGLKPYFSNDSATVVKSVSLVGEIKTPSIASSVNITPIIPSQSLLESRDEVFKEKENVEQDIAINSLHLFQGYMKLPSLSFHESLKEPTEIETVLKVVPPAYHHYLDVFSRMKEEKISPDHACDNHIELEGPLPPVGVI
ncbi:hypothetical protein O181_078534 [Austropuccinia psidii MF-1]|uniref:Uncharacterized protein n=1 Tax=Austropuccinia psidii MF-1 TaxID=1389203 RepID=A0A9Q3FH42_9BASI|nr:hypothetical protein [Austropuccinia psidii MF-1]